MKKQTVTLVSLDKKIDQKFDFLDQKFDQKFDFLDKKIEVIDFKFEAKIDALDKKIDSINSKLGSKIDCVDKKIDDLTDFLKENIMLRNETEQRIDVRVDTKFLKYTSDQFEFQDQVGKRCENNEHENLAIRYDVDDVKKRLGFIEKHVGV